MHPRMTVLRELSQLASSRGVFRIVPSNTLLLYLSYSAIIKNNPSLSQPDKRTSGRKLKKKDKHDAMILSQAGGLLFSCRLVVYKIDATRLDAKRFVSGDNCRDYSWQ